MENKENIIDESSEKIEKKFPNKKDKYMNELNVEAKSSMKARLITAIILIIIVVPCVVFGNYVFASLILIASLFGIHELLSVPQSIEYKFSKGIYIIGYVTMITVVFYAIVKDNLANLLSLSDKSTFVFDLANNFNAIELSLPVFVICVAAFLYAVLIDKKFNLRDAFYLIVMILVVGLGFQSFLFLRYVPFVNAGISINSADAGYKYGVSILPIIYLLLGTCVNDAGAYFVGVLFGKHKFAPRMSPKKTWEGTIGGAVISFGVSFGFGMIMSSAGVPILEGVLDGTHFYNILVLSLLMPIFATFGDLIFSCVKRYYGIKDFGKILKGHGGFIDRLDSLFINGILLSLFIEVMMKGWKVF